MTDTAYRLRLPGPTHVPDRVRQAGAQPIVSHRGPEFHAVLRDVQAMLRPIFGARLHETPTTAQLLADDLLTIAMERGGVREPPIVPYEAAAAFCMILLEDHRMLTVHFVGMPPGTANILFKFVRPETLERFGGPDKFAQAVDSAVTRLGLLLREPERIKALLFGDA